MTKLASIWALIRYELIRAISPGRWIPTILICFFALVPLVVRMPGLSGAREHRVFFWIMTAFYLGLVPMISSLLQAIPATVSEMKEATSTFIFTGVLPRPVIFLVKARGLSFPAVFRRIAFP